MAAVTKIVFLLVLMAVVGFETTSVVAQVHHVVGGDRGWDPSSDVASWSSGRIFAVGDKIWFTYSAAQESIAEIQSKEEYEACDVSNPIKMYTDGLDSIPLNGEGIRYFASTNPESCKNGLKLHVEVMPEKKSGTTPKVVTSEGSALAADAPTAPSGSTHVFASSLMVLAGLMLCYLGF